MVDATHATRSSSRPDPVLEVVAFAAERLLSSNDWREAAEEVLGRLGRAAEASRVSIIENDPGAIEPTYTIVAEWCADGIAPVMDDPTLRGVAWGVSFPTWPPVLASGEALIGSADSQPPQERAELTRQGVYSFAYFPIHVDGAWWGCVGFDGCLADRAWDAIELEGLRTAAALLGSAIERHAQTERLREAEARYRSVVEEIPAVTYFDVRDDDGVHLAFLSPQMEELLGFPPVRFLEDPEAWFELIHPEDRPRIHEAAYVARTAGTPFDEEYRMATADGRSIWVHDSKTPVKAAGGRLTHFQGFLIDVTARREAETRVADAEERYRDVVESIPAVTYVDTPTSEGGEIGAALTFVSPQIEDLLGISPDRFVADPGLWFELMHPGDRDRLERSGELDLAVTRTFDEEYRMRHADGHWVWVHDTSIASIGPDGALEHFRGFLVDITDRKRVEGELEAAEVRYRRFLETIPAVTYTDVPQQEGGEVVMGYVSPQIESLLGYRVERFLEDPELWFRLIHPEDLELLSSQDAFNVADETPFEHEYRMRHADGHWVWVHDTSIAVRGDRGDVEYFQGFLTDISGRRLAEARAREVEERFRVLVEEMPAIVYTERVAEGTTHAVAMDYVSPQAEEMLGHPAGSWLADVDFWSKIVHPDDRDRVAEATAIANTTGEPVSVDYRVFAADGRLVWLHEEALLIRGADGVPAYWQGFMVDVTERASAQEDLRQAEERFRMIVEHTPAVTYQMAALPQTHDPQETFLYVSPQVERLLGYPAERWSTTPGFWLEVIHPDDLEAVIDESATTAASGAPYRQEYRMIAADGRTVWIHDESHLIRDAEGAPTLWQGVMIDVTERTLARQALEQAKQRLQALVDHMPAIVYTESPSATAEDFYISPQVSTVLGHDAEEWASTPDFWVDHVHPDDLDAVLDVDRATDESREPYAAEYRFRRGDDTYVWLHDQAVFVDTAVGEGFWQGFLFDVTERKEAEQRIAAGEQRYRATVEHVPAVVYREPPSGVPGAGQLYISPQVEYLFGHTADEWQSTESFWADHIHPSDLDQVLEVNRVANETREPYAAEYRFRCADGDYIWIHDEATFVVGDDASWWQGFLFDITERKEAELQLREAEEKFRTIVEHNPAVIYTQEFDPQEPSASRTTYISPRQEAVFGISVEEVLNDPTRWTRMIHPEDRDRVLAADIESNERAPDRFSMEYRMLAEDGRIVWVQDDAQLVQIEGRAPFWQGFLLDITERKRAEERLERALEVEREATQRLRALDDMKNTFLQAVSHDLRTPLAAILGLAITLERGDVKLDEDDARDLANRIAGNARRLDRLVMNLLDLDRLARGIVSPSLERTDVGDLVRRVVAESELIADSRLRLDIGQVMAPVDAAKLERVVENLLANTARHTPADSTVWVGVRAMDDGVLITVDDDGPGVPPELRESIFEPFRQGDAPQPSPGVGVGLALVRRFVELHEGRAWVEERDGGGASFRVWLPGTPEGDGRRVGA